MYGINPFSAENATKDPAHPPSIFGALPYPGSASAVPHTLVTLRFTALSPTVLDCKVVGPSNETAYRVVTNGQAYTLLKDRAGRDLAAVAWATHPTVEGHGIERQPVGQWLQLSADRRCGFAVPPVGVVLIRFCRARTIVHGEVRYLWAPNDRFLHVCRLLGDGMGCLTDFFFLLG